jgi:predicted dehydrogenase
VTTFALIGSGWRARMFLRVARELGTIGCGGVVVRTPRRLDVPVFTSLDACLREVGIDFVLTATPGT